MKLCYVRDDIQKRFCHFVEMCLLPLQVLDKKNDAIPIWVISKMTVLFASS